MIEVLLEQEVVKAIDQYGGPRRKSGAYISYGADIRADRTRVLVIREPVMTEAVLIDTWDM
jgi:hypothetical protein